MLSLIKSKKKHQDHVGNRSGHKILGGSGKRSKSLISRPIEVLTSANLNKQGAEELDQQQQVHHQHHQEQEQVEPQQQQPQLVVNSSGGAVLLQSGGGLSFGFTAMELPTSRPSSAMPTSERPSSRASNSSRRSNQPRLGIGGSAAAGGGGGHHSIIPAPSNTYLFEDDPGIMSEIETSSTRKSNSHHHHHHSYHHSSSSHHGRPPPAASSGAALRTAPRTSPASRSSYTGGYSSTLYDDDPGIMSEAETASTTRGKSRNSSSIRNNSIPTNGSSMGSRTPSQRSVQFRYPVAQFHNLFDDLDPGIMSEADTSSTSSRKRRQHQLKMTSAAVEATVAEHAAKIRDQQQQQEVVVQQQDAVGGGVGGLPLTVKDNLPIVRTPSKTLERPLGLVFLVYRGETKRAVLPNEITSLDTVKALFVRSFPKTLTMEYMDTPRVHIYIHDSSKDIFYELENLSEIRDRTILKLFEADSSGRGPSGLGPLGLPPITNTEEAEAAIVQPQQTVPVPPTITEPEYVDSRHVKAMKVLNRVQREYEAAVASTTTSQQSSASASSSAASMGAPSSNTLPRNAFSTLEQEKLVEMLQGRGNNATNSNILTSQKSMGERSKTLGPGFMRGHHHNTVSGYASSPDGSYDVMIPPRFQPEAGGRYYPRPESTEEAKARMMHMEAQLSQLTGMVEKALKNKKLGKKTVSFDKSISYSDDTQPPSGILVTNKKHNHRCATTTNELLQIQTSANNVVAAVAANSNHSGGIIQSVNQDVDMHHNLKRLQKSARELKQEVKVLRRLTQLQSMAMKDLVQDTYIKLREACISFSTTNNVIHHPDPELWRLTQDEETFIKDLNELVQTFCQLEAKVEETRSGVINKKNKISLVEVEAMALTLSKSSKTVTLLKQAFPTLESNIKANPTVQNPEKRRMTEDFLKRTPDRMENIWRRCKKLTGTLVTLKRLASVQEQRFHPGSAIEMSLSPTPTLELQNNGVTAGSLKEVGIVPIVEENPEFSNNITPITTTTSNSIVNKKSPNKRRPRSTEVKDPPQVIVSNNSTTTNGVPAPAQIITKQITTTASENKAAPPPPPPRSSSTKSNDIIMDQGSTGTNSSKSTIIQESTTTNNIITNNSKPGPPVAAKPTNVDIKTLTAKARQDALEQRHQELLSRQKQLQEQYQRLQNMQQQGGGSGGGGVKAQPTTPATSSNGGSSSSLSSNSSSVASVELAVPISTGVTPSVNTTTAASATSFSSSSSCDTQALCNSSTTALTTKSSTAEQASTPATTAAITTTHMEHTVSQQPKSVEPTAAVEKQQQQQFPEKITKQTLKKPPAVPMRTNSSLSNSNKTTTTTITNNNQKDQKVYETDII